MGGHGDCNQSNNNKKKKEKKKDNVAAHTSALGEEKRSIFGLIVFLKDTETQRKDDEYK